MAVRASCRAACVSPQASPPMNYRRASRPWSTGYTRKLPGWSGRAALHFVMARRSSTASQRRSRWCGPLIKRGAFYLGLALLFTHELDAMPNHEWRVLPLLRSLSDSMGELTFVLGHIPLFVIVLAGIGSLNSRTRSLTRDLASGFLLVHALLHFAFSGHPSYEFRSLVSTLLIYGAAACGLVYLLARWLQLRSDN